ncbi:MAG: hypothetical protein ABW186_07990 [Rhodanobacteraceae bacterium]
MEAVANLRLPRRGSLAFHAFLLAIWLPLLAVLVSPALPGFVAGVLRDPSTFDAERNRLRAATPLWNRAVAFYTDALYALGVSGRPGAAEVGRDGWVFLGDIFSGDFSQSLGRRVLDDREVAGWTQTFALETSWLAARNIGSAIVVAPSKGTIYPDRLPRWNDGRTHASSLDRILAAAPALPLIDTRAALRDARASADTYSALNSHWTDYGAYVAWTKIAPELGRRIPALASLRAPALASIGVEDGHNEFAGMLGLEASNAWTTYRLEQALGDYAIVADDGATRTAPGVTETDLLDLPRTTRNEHARTSARVLVLRDSSGNSLSPFLQDAFRETYQVDHKLGAPGRGPNLAALVDRFHPDVVLWVIAERYLAESAGDPAYWRAANAFDCANAEAAGPSASASGGNVELAGDGTVYVARVTIDASADGEIAAEPASERVSPRRVNFSRGSSELYFNVDRVKPGDHVTLRPSANVAVKSVETRAGGCLAGSSVTGDGAATAAPSSPSSR